MELDTYQRILNYLELVFNVDFDMAEFHSNESISCAELETNTKYITLYPDEIVIENEAYRNDACNIRFFGGMLSDPRCFEKLSEYLEEIKWAKPERNLKGG